MINPKEYKKALQNLKVIDKKDDKQKKIFNKEHEKISDKFWKLEKTLNSEKQNVLESLREKRKQFENKIEKEKEPFCLQISEFKRVINFMELIKDSDKSLDFDVYYYGYKKDNQGKEITHYKTKEGNWKYLEKDKIPYEPIAVIKNDEYASIKAFIVDNGKPKNKFSLVVVGKTIFNEKLCKKNYDYGCHFRSYRDNINSLLRDAPTKEELLTYFEKIKPNILKDYLEEHKKVEQEYKEAIQRSNRTNQKQGVGIGLLGRPKGLLWKSLF